MVHYLQADLKQNTRKAGLLVEFCYNEGITATISLFFAFIKTKEEINFVVDIFKKVFDKMCQYANHRKQNSIFIDIPIRTQ